MNSSDEDDEQMKPDELTGVYTSEMDPKAGPLKLTPDQVAYQRAAAKGRKEQMILSVPRVESPQPEEVPEVVDTHVNMSLSGGSSDDDDLSRPEHVWSNTLGKMRRNKAWTRRLANSALALPAPEPEPVPEAKASKPVTGQESPETKVSKPMQTRRQAKEASGAGGLRGVVGSWSTGYVCDKLSPSSKPGS
jgi:hypothetical protein